jgi:hypothetical protein
VYAVADGKLIGNIEHEEPIASDVKYATASAAVEATLAASAARAAPDLRVLGL